MPEEKDTLFGKLAIDREYATREQVDEAFKAQAAAAEVAGVTMPLSQIMVGKGMLSKDQAQELANSVAIQTGEARLVGDYEVLSKLGQGGMGAVYKAKHTATGELVALKILPPSLATPDLVKRFQREAEMVQRLRHDNIVGCVEFGRDARRKCYFCALELVEGEDLDKRIKALGVLPEDEAVSISIQIAMALENAHHEGLVHRDVKPGNIMVTANGTAKLLDLGLARPASQEATRLTQSGLFVGSAYYASPEQALGDRSLDIRSDIYSLGATMYHMVTGKPPFAGTTIMQVLQKHVKEKLPWPAETNPGLSDGLCSVIAKMMAKDPEERYRDPEELLRDLDVLREGGEPAAVKAPPKRSTVAVPRRRHASQGRAPKATDRKPGRRRRPGRVPGVPDGAPRTKGAAKHAQARTRQMGHRRRKASDTDDAARGRPPWLPYAAVGGGVALLAAVIGVIASGNGGGPSKPSAAPSTPPRVVNVAPIDVPVPEDMNGDDTSAAADGKPPTAPEKPAGDAIADDEFFAKLRAASEERRRIAEATAADWRTVCDGTSLEGIAEWSRKYWRVQDGALALDLSRAEGNMGLLGIPGTFRDVEVAVRFSLSRPSVVPHIGLGVRYAPKTDAGPEKQYKASIHGGSLAPGEHELRIAVRGDAATATVDGKATSVENKHSPRDGWTLLVVIQTEESGFRIHSIRMREPAAVDPVDLARGLVGYWKFDEGEGTVARDSSGRGNHGKIVGGARWAKGRIAGALEFDGKDDFVLLPNESSFDITGSITVAAWIRVASFTTSFQAIVTKGDRAWRLQRAEHRDSLDWACTDLSRGEVGDFYGKVTVNDGRWHHVAGVFDGTMAYIFVDGTVDVSARSPRTISVNDHSVCIGENAQVTGRRFHGLIDDVRIYDRALSAAEVRTLASGALTAPAAPATAGARPATVPADAVEFGGHWYKVFGRAVTWHEAKRLCEEQGGHLLTVTSREENEFVKGLARPMPDDVWLGFTDEGHEGRWTWVTGEPVAFTAWDRTEPSNVGNREHWAVYFHRWKHTWHDAPADHDGGAYFVCEWEPAAPPAVAAARPAAVPADAVELGGHWYKLTRRAVTWHEAKRLCEKQGGHLVTITSPEEQRFAADMARRHASAPWIGLTEEGHPGEWRWVTGEPVAFEGWAKGEPNNFLGQAELWASLFPVYGYAWIDVTGAPGISSGTAFICEWEPAGGAATAASAALLDEFDAFVSKSDWAGARRWAEREAGSLARSEREEGLLRAAARVAKALEARAGAIRKGAETLVGKDAKLATSKGTLSGKVGRVTDDGIVLEIKRTMRGAGTIETRLTVRWSELAPGTEAELASAGGWRAEGADAATAEAILAISRRDKAAAGAALARAGDHPLAAHYRSRLAGARAPDARAPGPAAPAPTIVGRWYYEEFGNQYSREFTADGRCIFRRDETFVWSVPYRMEEGAAVVTMPDGLVLRHELAADGRLNVEGKFLASRRESGTGAEQSR